MFVCLFVFLKGKTQSHPETKQLKLAYNFKLKLGNLLARVGGGGGGGGLRREASIGESLFTVFVSLAYAHHYLRKLIEQNL